jgi:hypothetical protein
VLEAGQHLGGYRLERRLGRGGMGEVWQATHLATGGRRALKVLLDLVGEDLARFQREGLAMARVDGHPHLIRVHEQLASHPPALAMELATGGDLEERLRSGRLRPTVAAAIVEALARGLAHAHAQGVLHRDLKPQNVLFDAEGRPKLTDFGLALIDRRNSLTESGSVLGTPAYMAPEAARGEHLDESADVYGLGAILHHCLSGGPPFQAGSVMATLSSVVNDPPAPLPDSVPRWLRRVCDQALSKSPRDRQPNAQALADSLKAGLSGETASPRVNLGVAALLCACGVLAAAGGVALTAEPRPKPSRAVVVQSPRAEPVPSPTLHVEKAPPRLSLERLKTPPSSRAMGLAVARALDGVPALESLAFDVASLTTEASPNVAYREGLAAWTLNYKRSAAAWFLRAGRGGNLLAWMKLARLLAYSGHRLLQIPDADLTDRIFLEVGSAGALRGLTQLGRLHVQDGDRTVGQAGMTLAADGGNTRAADELKVLGRHPRALERLEEHWNSLKTLGPEARRLPDYALKPPEALVARDWLMARLQALEGSTWALLEKRALDHPVEDATAAMSRGWKEVSPPHVASEELVVKITGWLLRSHEARTLNAFRRLAEVMTYYPSTNASALKIDDRGARLAHHLMALAGLTDSISARCVDAWHQRGDLEEAGLALGVALLYPGTRDSAVRQQRKFTAGTRLGLKPPTRVPPEEVWVRYWTQVTDDLRATGGVLRLPPIKGP